MERKRPIYQGLNRIPVLIEDTSLTSEDYLKITYITQEFNLGKNVIKFKGAPELFLNNSNIYVEVLDSNGDPIYYEATLDRYSYRQSAVVNIFITDDIPPGPTKVYICGTLSKDKFGRPLNTNSVNFRWSTEVYTDVTLINQDEIEFETLPNIAVSCSVVRYEPLAYDPNIINYRSSIGLGTNYQYRYTGKTATLLYPGAIWPNAAGGVVYIPTASLLNVDPPLPGSLTSTYLTGSITSRPSYSLIELENPLTANVSNRYGTYVFNTFDFTEATFSYYFRDPNWVQTIDKFVNKTDISLTNLVPTVGTIKSIKTYVRPSNLDSYIFAGESFVTASSGIVPSSSYINLNVPSLIKSDYLDFKFEFINPYGKISKQILEKKGIPYIGGNTYIEGNDNVLTGSLHVTGSIDVTGSIAISGGLYLPYDTEVYRWGHKLFNYGQFYSTITQSGSANTPYSMSFNNSESWNRGVYLVSGSQITVENAGVYDLQFSAQLFNTANTTIDFDIWFKKDGTNIPYSNSQVQLTKAPGTTGRQIAAWNYTTEFNSGSYIEIIWGCTDATGQLQAVSPSGSIPGGPEIPSVIATLTQTA